MKLYRLVFANEAEALSLVAQLQKSEDNPDGYTALDMRGKQVATITPAYVDDNGIEHDAVMDDRFFATVISSIDVPELQSYITDVEYFPMKYMGENSMEIVTKQ